jgi:hypothetical protein
VHTHPPQPPFFIFAKSENMRKSVHYSRKKFVPRMVFTKIFRSKYTFRLLLNPIRIPNGKFLRKISRNRKFLRKLSQRQNFLQKFLRTFPQLFVGFFLRKAKKFIRKIFAEIRKWKFSFHP